MECSSPPSPYLVDHLGPAGPLNIFEKLLKKTRRRREDSVTKDVENLALFEDVSSEIATLPHSQHFL